MEDVFVGVVDVDPGPVGAASTGLGFCFVHVGLENRVEGRLIPVQHVTGSIRGLIPDQSDHTHTGKDTKTSTFGSSGASNTTPNMFV